MPVPKIIVLTGPTATGKSKLALEWCRRLDAEIVSADSIQVYKYLNIGSAKPEAEILRAFPHHLIDRIDPDEEYHAGRFAEEADDAIGKIRARNRHVIVVGGTGLYLRALIRGLVKAPPVSFEAKEEVDRIFQAKGVVSAYRRLKELDPETARNLNPSDSQRIDRAMKFFLTTGKSLASLQKEHPFSTPRYDSLIFTIAMERRLIYERINQRVLTMIKRGLVRETESLIDRGYGSSLKSMNSIGYKQATAYLEGKMEHATMVESIQTKTRNYAKRQITWHGNNPEIVRIQPAKEEEAFERCLRFLALESGR